VKTTHHRPIYRREGRRSRQSIFVRWRVLIVWALVFGWASAGTVFAGQSQVDICHINGQGEYQLITIADPAFATHIAHGDKAVEHFFIDADGDGFGSSALRVEACTAPEGFVADHTDCDDTNPAVHPGATEIEGNGIDDDCNPATPDRPPPQCPCEGMTHNETTWDASFQTQSCYLQYHGSPVQLYDITTTHVGILGVYTSPFWGDPYPTWCEIGGGPLNGSIELLAIAPTTAEEHIACVQSLLHIAASDGVTCPSTP